MTSVNWLYRQWSKLVRTLTSASPLAVNTKQGGLGHRHIEVVDRAWGRGFKVSSDFAREYAPHVAMAASAGHITTEEGRDFYGKTWRITQEGLRVLDHGF